MAQSVLVDAIRLPPEDYENLEELSEERAIPMRTLARSFLTQKIREERGTG